MKPSILFKPFEVFYYSLFSLILQIWAIEVSSICKQLSIMLRNEKIGWHFGTWFGSWIYFQNIFSTFSHCSAAWLFCVDLNFGPSRELIGWPSFLKNEKWCNKLYVHKTFLQILYYNLKYYTIVCKIFFHMNISKVILK